ncbi:MAG: hypothetical protein RIF41_32975 [Polyangiaceae bacterium]
MDLITLGIIAAASAGSVIVARFVARRRGIEEQEPAPEDGETEPEPVPSPTEGLPVGLCHVVQVEDDTRWPQSGILVHHDGRLHGAILLTEEGGIHQATVSLAPPAQHLYWLTRRELPMPSKPPTRIEIDGLLLDRTMSFPAKLEGIGVPRPNVGQRGQFCLYEGSVGDGAVILIADETYVWYGRRLGEGDWDSLGEVEPETD